MNKEFDEIAYSIKNKLMSAITVDDIKELIASVQQDFAEDSGAAVCMSLAGWFTEFDGDREPYFSHIELELYYVRSPENYIVIKSDTAAEDVMKKITDHLEACREFANEIGIFEE